jgi:general secretion pathway protein G
MTTLRGNDKVCVNAKGQAMNKARAFTLVEILVVVVLLGILAAVVIATVGNSTTSAKASALATDLQLLRNFILVYKSQHLEVAPGPTEQAFIEQATMSSNASGQTAAVGTAGFERGPYMQKIPVNPFNNLTTIQMLADGDDFPPNADDSHGWICKGATAEIRADTSGTDNNGKRYYDY